MFRNESEKLIANVMELDNGEKWKTLMKDLDNGMASELKLMAIDYADKLVALSKDKLLEINTKVKELTDEYLAKGSDNSVQVVLRPNLDNAIKGLKNSVEITPYIDVVVIIDRFDIAKGKYGEYRTHLSNLVNDYVTALDPKNNYLEDEKEKGDNMVIFSFSNYYTRRGRGLIDMTGNTRILSNNLPESVEMDESISNIFRV